MKRYTALVCSVILLVGVQADNFSVEPLTVQEVKKIDEAEKDFLAAKMRYEMTLAEVKFAHGQTPGQAGFACGSVIASVELKGKYALITRTRYTDSCVIPAASGQPKPEK